MPKPPEGVVAAVEYRRSDSRSARAAAGAAGAICAIAIGGWLTDLAPLTRFVPGLPTMTLATACAFLLLSAGVGLGSAAPRGLRLAVIGLALVLTLGALLFAPTITPSQRAPGAIPALTAAALLGLGASAWALLHPALRRHRARLWPCTGAMTLAYVASIGFLVDVRWTGVLGSVMGAVSLPTATVILLLGSALHRLDRPRVVSTAHTGVPVPAGLRYARMALPLAVLVPVAVGWTLETLVREGWLERSNGAALALGLLGTCFGLLALASALWISRLEGALRANEITLQRKVRDRTMQLAQAERAAESARMRLAHVVQEADVGILSVDVHGAIVLCNAAAGRMFGRDPTTLMGGRIDLLLPPEALPRHDEHMQAFRAEPGGARRMGLPGQDIHGVRQDGSAFVLDTVISRSGTGDDMLLTAVLRDMTDALALQSAREARTAAESAARARSEQLGHISHELRTPLNAVIGITDLMLTDGEAALSPRQQEWLGLVKGAGDHMLRVIDDLVQLSRLDSGADRLDLGPVDAAAMLRSLAQWMDAHARSLAVRIVVALPPEAACWVVADERRLRQVLLNILGNALKYNRAGGEVELRTQSVAGGDIALICTDTGLGMSPEQLAHVFEPFNRVGREHSRVEGSGLGLALARAMVTAMHGRIEARSDPGAGSTFSVILPASAAPS